MTTQAQLDNPRRPYQDTAFNKLVQLKRAPLISPMGSGKTRVAADTYQKLKGEDRWAAGIICPLNAQLAWFKQLQLWLDVDPARIGIADGNKEQRYATWSQLGKKYQFVITTYSSYLRDKDFIPNYIDMFMDEPHRVLRNRTNQTFPALQQKTLHSDIVMLVDGTPMRHGPQDMFTFLNICKPKFFSSYWRFVNTWCFVEDGYFGKEIVGPRNMDNFITEVLLKFAAYITMEEVAPFLPEKNRELVPIKATAKQYKLLEQIKKDMMYVGEDGQLELTPNVMTQILRHRQILCCPKILNTSWEYGACLETILERIQDLDVPRPVIFTPFTAAILHIVELLSAKLEKGRKIWTLQGGTKIQELNQITTRFNNSDNDVLVCSVHFAESFELPRSSWAFFCGFDWSWDVNAQAEDRLRRLTSEAPNIHYNYFRHEGTLDGEVLAHLNQNHRNVSAVTPKNLHLVLRG